MQEDILKKISLLNEVSKNRFEYLRKLIYDSCDKDIEEKLWAGLPSYYVGDKFIRLIPFKNYINIEAIGIKYNLDRLKGYTLTPKLMIKLSNEDKINEDLFKDIFKNTLE